MPARSPLAVVSALAAVAALSLGSAPPLSAGGAAPRRPRSILAGQPLAFEPAPAQTGSTAPFIARGNGYAVRLEPGQALLSLRKSAEQPGVSLGMKVLGADRNAKASPASELPGRSNYLTGRDPSGWRVGVPRYAAVRYEGVYRGVDIVYHGDNQRQLEYDFVVAPGTDPRAIRLGFEGVEGLALDDRGDLVVHAAGGDVTWRAPVAYQDVRGARRAVRARYELRGKAVVGFRLADYDKTKTLVIDPVLAYSTYLRGNNEDFGLAIAVDGAGNAYATGQTYSTDFPTVGALQGSPAGGSDAFVTKLSATGVLVYSTYLGGSADDKGLGIAVDGSGSAFVAGQTSSPDFPTVNAIQTTLLDAADAFVAKLAPAGDSLVYSTYLGGNKGDSGQAVGLDGSGSAYVTGFTTSTDFPTVNPYQATLAGTGDAFVSKLSPTGSALLYSTYLGMAPGFNGAIGRGIAVDGSGSAYVAGELVMVDGLGGGTAAKQSEGGGDFDAFAVKLSPAGNVRAYAVFIGGSGGEEGKAIAVDAAGHAYVTGFTDSADFPTVNAAQGAFAGGTDAFVVELSPDGTSFVYSTYLGGSGFDGGFGIALDGAGNAYATGITNSEDFPTVDPIQGSKGFDGDAFLTKISAGGTAIAYSTYFGDTDPALLLEEGGTGVAVDGAGNAHVVGFVTEPHGPDQGTGGRLRHGAAKTPPVGETDAFVFRVESAPQNQPPDCGAAAASPASLWPPNHRLIPIAVTGVTDPEGDPVSLTVTAIAQDEPTMEAGTGSGHFCPDATGLGTASPVVRAERAGTVNLPGNGRVYHIAFTATDAAGASCQGVATVCVPHDSAGAACIDDGSLFDSTVCGSAPPGMR